VHRDLSLRNIMVSYAGEVKIIDFGIARGDIGRYKTAPGIVLGTLRYMSPEQAMAAETDRRSDLYTLGVVLYEMLAGQRCVPAGSHSEIMRAVISDAPIPLTTLNPAIPTQLARVVMKALEKSPEKRFQSANAFRSALLEGNTLIEDAAVAHLTFRNRGWSYL
jgi:serine/threonine protein kinase